MKTTKWLKTGMLAGLLLTGATVTVAESAPSFAPVLTDLCATMAPDATRTLGPGVHTVRATSNGGIYAYKPFCPRHVVDIRIPFNSSGTAGDLRTASLFRRPGSDRANESGNLRVDLAL